MIFNVRHLCALSLWSLLLFTSLIEISHSAEQERAKLVIVVDDFGYRPANELAIMALDSAINVAILPNAPYTATMHTAAIDHGNEILIHLPMEPLHFKKIEPHTLRPEMDYETIEYHIDDALAQLPHAIGVNNHMGSRMTQDFKGMLATLHILQARERFFLDSVTIANRPIEAIARWGVIPLLERDIFLDNIQSVAAIRAQFQQGVNIARQEGIAIMIAHPYDETLTALRLELTSLPHDIELIPISGAVRISEARSTPFGERLLENLREMIAP